MGFVVIYRDFPAIEGEIWENDVLNSTMIIVQIWF